ncbi:hypothetical protein SeMB42_g02803 [Synchytrium endobioticum]|uniref:Uncharacterized protein n=1 Tax=Synchytrium endobioticum TaxID=286115 RepID=A0A507CYZ4_9FUNG|nr:hypothetical protein SeLEV6574_g04691 [Synchytrium endobioticum]TPX48949.1 hypothetical protein SeMB42_g02803 [Synchytrium endobioticum]
MDPKRHMNGTTNHETFELSSSRSRPAIMPSTDTAADSTRQHEIIDTTATDLLLDMMRGSTMSSSRESSLELGHVRRVEVDGHGHGRENGAPNGPDAWNICPGYDNDNVSGHNGVLSSSRYFDSPTEDPQPRTPPPSPVNPLLQPPPQIITSFESINAMLLQTRPYSQHWVNTHFRTSTSLQTVDMPMPNHDTAIPEYPNGIATPASAFIIPSDTASEKTVMPPSRWESLIPSATHRVPVAAEPTSPLRPSSTHAAPQTSYYTQASSVPSTTAPRRTTLYSNPERQYEQAKYGLEALSSSLQSLSFPGWTPHIAYSMTAGIDDLNTLVDLSMVDGNAQSRNLRRNPSLYTHDSASMDLDAECGDRDAAADKEVNWNEAKLAELIPLFTGLQAAIQGRIHMIKMVMKHTYLRFRPSASVKELSMALATPSSSPADLYSSTSTSTSCQNDKTRKKRKSHIFSEVVSSSTTGFVDTLHLLESGVEELGVLEQGLKRIDYIMVLVPEEYLAGTTHHHDNPASASTAVGVDEPTQPMTIVYDNTPQHHLNGRGASGSKLVIALQNPYVAFWAIVVLLLVGAGLLAVGILILVTRV